MSRLPPRTFWFRLLRLATLLAGLTVCGVVLARGGAGLPWLEVSCLCLGTAVLRLRVVVMRRDAQSVPTLFHFPGTALITIALLRDGPVAALVVNLVSALVVRPFLQRRSPLLNRQVVGDPFCLGMLSYGFANLYFALGGHLLRTPADAASLFQRPAAVLLPLIGASLVIHQLLLRPLTCLALSLRDGEPARSILLDRMFGFFYDTEIIGGAFALALWATWGWGTVPYTLLINEALLLAARSHYERIDARREAECDTLTGLASWRGLDNALRRRIAVGPRKNATFALVFLDVDGLKGVNDTYGHAVGDELLRLVGETCRLHARQRDLVSRRSGDEFLIIFDALDRAAAERVVRRLQSAIEDAFAVHSQFQGIAGVSVGLSIFPDDAHDAPTLIEMADRQMYHNKRARKAARADEPENVLRGGVRAAA